MSNLMRILIALCCVCTVSAVTQILNCDGKQYTLVDGLVCPAGHEPISDKTLDACKEQYCPSLNNWARAKGGTNMILKNQGTVCTAQPADAACQQQICQTKSGSSDGGITGGAVFLIIFFVGGFVYFAGGFAYNFKMKELRGTEAVPNVAFWKDLPLLVKDGALFIKNKATGGGGYTSV
eukprot:Rhum_TRINITY_DN14634_c0_g1::Rhum_TRINITY_DN14634_c0_g1_i1::g.104691::m.104691